ncbi:hypothetical protein BST14_27770 [Mycobacterium arosiense ATCC BAA-1401 = DSM 45069]|uniref:Uncharacterized protein n=1 Tax=Mycobacterium arosiense ATCC BAA-1401 = DSM 45069 TaxID=1265311 RepID=A0A1W9Z517_MYCAI|nr:hypothetical protein BST14_27770 [Mycobacterium arosiense ATCC BAA-1401 = DSM 45069]
MTEAERGDAFQRFLDSTEPYNAKIREEGDLPWFEDSERREKVAARLGLPTSTSPDEVRRALFMRHRKATND